MDWRKLHLVRDKGRVSEPVSSLSRDEEAHLLDLADTALANQPEPDPKLQAGNNARQEHKKLKQELQNTVDRLDHDPAA